jgi:hypothetical protein
MTLDELKLKAALMLAAQEICEEAGDHIWGEPYFTQIREPSGFPYRPGDSVACVRCGKRIPMQDLPRPAKFAN